LSRTADDLLAQWIEHHLVHGERLDPRTLCADHPELEQPLRERIRDYEQLQELLAPTEALAAAEMVQPAASQPVAAPPRLDGFRTLECLGAGGGGTVYKLEDLKLGRFVAAKVLRREGGLQATAEEMLSEARSLALFDDPRIVRVFEIRSSNELPVILMEHVDGFELDRIGPSLEFRQRARIVIEVAEAIHRAHELGIQHRDLKPANILLDANLQPKILDFGLSSGEAMAGHGRGTLAYMAPEQLDHRCQLDARTDIYALGVVLYELLCGARPYRGSSSDELMAAIRGGEPQLPAELEPEVPEPLQAIALKAMEREPDQRYTSAHEMAADIQRFLDNRPVLARPSLYHSLLGRRTHSHLEQIREWLRLRLIYPHEASDLKAAYQRLHSREDDWIALSRTLSFSQIALYLGAFLLLCGGLLYFQGYLLEVVQGLTRPALILGAPFAGLNITAFALLRRQRKAVAVAFFLAAAALLPLLLIILLREGGLWPAAPDDPNQLLSDGWISNRQLQVATLIATVWSAWLALRTRTVALSTTCTLLAVLLHLAVLTDAGLRQWLESGSWDRLAFWLLPLTGVLSAMGYSLEARKRPFFARPMYTAGALLLVSALELLALDGKLCAHIGITLAPFQPETVDSPLLLDTLAAMTLNGVLIYLTAWLLERFGSSLMAATARLLYILSPFAILEPICYLNGVAEYSERFLWLYLGLALAITFLSHFRQRKSFYYAGLFNTGSALWLITDRYQWHDRPLWAVVVIAVGLAVLLTGWALDSRERLQTAIGPSSDQKGES
jgi:serine/threonine protein kinase